MMCIRDREGNVTSKSLNLAGIRRYVSGHTPPVIKVLDVSEIGAGGGRLCILFEIGCSFEANFATFSILKGFVRRWRNVRGAPLTTHGQPAGKVSTHNPV